MIAVCSIAQGIGLYSLPRLSQTQTIHHPFFREGVIVDAEFTQSDSLLVVGSDHGRVYIYDVFTGTLVMALPHTSPGMYLAGYMHTLLQLMLSPRQISSAGGGVSCFGPNDPPFH